MRRRRSLQPWRRSRQGRGTGPRRRRLCDQAVRHGGAVRADAGRAAPSAAGARGAAGAARGRSERRSRAPHREGCGQGGAAVSQGIRAPAAARAACRQGPDAPLPPAGALAGADGPAVSAGVCSAIAA